MIVAISKEEGVVLNILKDVFPLGTKKISELSESHITNTSKRLHRLQDDGYVLKTENGWLLTPIGEQAVCLIDKILELATTQEETE